MRELGFDDETIVRYSYNRYNGKSDYEANSKEALENRLLDMYLAVLTNANTFNEVRQPLDTVTDYLKNHILSVVDSLTQQSKASTSSPLYYVTPQFQSKTKAELSGGKRGIGPFALAASHHALTQQVGLTLANNKGSEILQRFGITNVSGIRSNQNNHAPGFEQVNTNILDWLSAMINAHVDVAKDPYIIRLNVRSLTYNMTNFLLRTGVGETTFYFLPQQILKDFAVEYDKYAGFYGVDLPAYANPESTAHRNVWNKYFEAANKLATTPTQKKKLADLKKNPSAFLSSELLDINWLMKQLNVKDDSYKSFDWYFNQLRVMKLYDAFTPASRSLSALTTLSQIDTKKFGNNFGLESAFLVRWKNFVQTDGTFDNPLSMFTSTFLYQKLVNGMLFPRDAFKNVMLRLTPQFEIWRNKLHALTGTLGSSNNDTINSITRAMEAQYKSAFFDKYCKDHSINVDELLYGKNSIVNRFYTLRNRIIRGEYPALLDSTGRLENALLNSLVPRQKYDTLDAILPDFFELKFNKDGNDGMDDILIRAWEELSDSEYADVREFARDLAIYSFYTSGDAFGRNNFFKYVPNSLRESLGYFDYVRNLESDPNNLSQFAQLTNPIFRNLWWNEDIVPTVEYIKPTTEFDKATGEVYQTDGKLPNQESGYTIQTDDGKYLDVPGIFMNTRRPRTIGFNEQGDTIYTPYVKIRLNGDLDPRYTMLYRFIGVAKDSQGNVEYPVYRLIPKFGVNMQGMTLLEFGKQSSSIGANNYYYKGSVDPTIFTDYRPIKDIAPTSLKNQVDVFNFLKDINTNSQQLANEQESSDTSIEDIKQYLAPDEEATNMIKEVVELANEGLTITDELGNFFTEEEQRKIQEATKDKRLFVKSASRRTDPVFFTENLINQLKENAKLPFGSPNRFYAMEIWTKHDGLPLVDLINACIKYRVAPMLSFSITTLGDTELEPGVMRMDDLLDRIEILINQNKINPDTTTIRIDPIIPGVTKFEDIEHVVSRASKLGITKFVSSVMQSYGYTENTANPRGVVPALSQRINYDWELYYGTNKNGIVNFRPKTEHVRPIGDFLKSLITKYGVKIESCASNDLGLPESACLDPIIIEKVTGVKVDATFKDKTRPNCMCYGAHGDMLKYSDACASCCAYCYGSQQNSNIPYKYYDENGNLNDFSLTRTSRTTIPSIVEPTGWDRFSDNGYEVSSAGDKRFSAKYAKFKEGTIINGTDVSGMTVEYVYQVIIKKSGKGKAPAEDSIISKERFEDLDFSTVNDDTRLWLTGEVSRFVYDNREPRFYTISDLEDFSYYEGYLPLWKEWANQNPDLIQELRNLSKGKTLTDKFATTRVSQARALYDILSGTIVHDRFSETEVQDQQTQSTDPTQELAEEWSKKEGWSVNHFYSEVLPKIDKAWQIEFELAPDQSVKADYTGRMDMDYNGDTREGIQSASTIEAIKRGERTATTRYERSDKPEYIEYWKQAKVGDVIEWKRGDESVKVIVTKPLTKLVNPTEQSAEVVQTTNDFDEFVRETSEHSNTTVLDRVREQIPQAVQLQKAKEDNGYTVTFNNGFKVSLPFTLNEQQEAALRELEAFVNDPTSSQFTLSGYAGTGKTTVIGIFKQYLDDINQKVVFTAPTHRANAVTRAKTPGATVMTLAKLFGLSVDVDLSSNNYDLRTLQARQTNDPKLEGGELIIIDEASMVQDDMYELIQNQLATYPGTKVIYVGDQGQLRPVKSDKISKVFTDADTPKMQLTKVERTGDNPILKESTRLRNGEGFSYETELVNGEGVTFTNDRTQIATWVKNALQSTNFAANKTYFKIVAGTNAAVEAWNRYARKVLFGTTEHYLVEGDLITGYNNALRDRFGEYQFINSMDYVVTAVKPTSLKYSLDGETVTLRALDVTLQNAFDSSVIPIRMSFAVPGQTQILAKMREYIDDLWSVYRTAKARGDRQSARLALQKINSITESLFLLENVKDSNGRLLFQKTADYGYAVTAHKSQGGTFNKVLVDEKSIHAFKNAELEKELKYVAVSRASEDVMVIADKSHIDNPVTNKPMSNNFSSADQMASDEANALRGIQPNAEASARFQQSLASLGLTEEEINELSNLGTQRKKECE